MKKKLISDKVAKTEITYLSRSQVLHSTSALKCKADQIWSANPPLRSLLAEGERGRKRIDATDIVVIVVGQLGDTTTTASKTIAISVNVIIDQYGRVWRGGRGRRWGHTLHVAVHMGKVHILVIQLTVKWKMVVVIKSVKTVPVFNSHLPFIEPRLKLVDKCFSVWEEKVSQVSKLAVLDNHQQFAFDYVLGNCSEQIDDV